jgi:hypothetical protein
MAEKRRGSDRVPIPIEQLETALGLDRPREVTPDDDTPTQPELPVAPCLLCRGDRVILQPINEGGAVHRHAQRICRRCKGSGLEPVPESGGRR